MKFDLFDKTVLFTIAGSRCYGIHTSESDVDIKGVAIPTTAYYLGGLQFEQADSPEHFADARFRSLLNVEESLAASSSKVEGSIYELRKAVRLFADGNPNMLDVLFCRDEDVRMMRPAGRKLRENRDLFLSRRLKHSLSGYAFSQLKRINLHRKWLLSPPTIQPTRKQFDLPESTLIPADQLNAAFALVKAKMDSWEFDFSSIESDSVRRHLLIQIETSLAEMLAGVTTNNSKADDLWRSAARGVGIDDNLLEIMERERRYRGAKEQWDNYNRWLNTRNPQRAALEAKHGYDTKHAGHLYRLMAMCEEFMSTGKLNVWRGDIDADYIVAIRNGLLSYDELIDMATKKEANLNALYKSPDCPVRHSPDMDKISSLMEEILTTELFAPQARLPD